MRMIRRKPTLLTMALLLVLIITQAPAAANQVSTVFDEASYRDIFRTLGDLGGYNVFIDDLVVGQGSFSLTDISVPEALDLVAEFSGYAYRFSENNLFISTKDRIAELEESEIRYIYLQYALPQAVAPAVEMVLSQQQIYAHPGSNLLILSGPAVKLDQAEALVAKIDMPPKLSLQEQRSVLSILQQVTAELHLDLVADPKLGDHNLIMDVWQLDPWEVLHLLEDMALLEIEQINQTLVARQIEEIPEKERIKVYRLNHIEPEAVANAISLILPIEKIQIDDKTKSVMVKASDPALEEIDEFISAYDLPLPQVYLEVWIQEMNVDVIQSLGIQWPKEFGAVIRKSEDPDALSAFELGLEPWEIAFMLQALEDEGKVKILASPKLATLSGQEATI